MHTFSLSIAQWNHKAVLALRDQVDRYRVAMPTTDKPHPVNEYSSESSPLQILYRQDSIEEL